MAKHPQKSVRILALVGVALVALGLVAIAGCGSGEDSDQAVLGSPGPDFAKALAEAPPALDDLYEPGGIVVEAGTEGYERQIAALEGYPIVANKWASWCGPCREEFPYFQEQAAKLGTEVAFVGINADDSTDAANTFLRDTPVPYPSFSDPDREITEALGATFFPSTIFYDETGEVAHVRNGQYLSEEELAADIRRYASG